jgi:hypothetical protein
MAVDVCNRESEELDSLASVMRFSSFPNETFRFADESLYSNTPLDDKKRPEGSQVGLPQYPRKRTQNGHRAMSEKCQKPTNQVVRQGRSAV